ncbi:MAG: restriction endonuclease [Patescibacteria group bacterium]|jgi:hypothetical protein
MLITKASGEQVQFSRPKYEESLRKVGLTVAEAKEISAQIYQDLYPSINSAEIYSKTQIVLKQKNRMFAAKYSLKRAIMSLGPTGFFFERYMAAVLSAYGYQTKYNQFLRGKCVEHEVDIVAERSGKKYMIECKYHNQPGVKSDVKVALYIYARFLDLREAQKFDEPVLITNTLCTTEAIKYARCSGLKIIGWHYPLGNQSLEHYIEAKKLYPVTVLTSLTAYLNAAFREANIVLASDLLKFSVTALAKRFKIKETLAQKLISEAKELTEV